MRHGGRDYCRSPLKRAFDLCGALCGLVVLAPLLLVLGLLVVLTSGRPALFLQDRVGFDGRTFRLGKFRTMRSGAAGLPITGSGDHRVTPVGRFLRATKLDELPQLVNIVRGDMSFVGPRPEIPRYVARYDAGQRRVLDARPGLTDPATILFRDEEILLGRVEEERREAYYVGELLPRKLALNLAYIDEASLRYDLELIVKTLWIVLVPGPS